MKSCLFASAAVAAVLVFSTPAQAQLLGGGLGGAVGGALGGGINGGVGPGGMANADWGGVGRLSGSTA
ncbi:MAG TPA: hypothetical protein VHE11_14130, partial [Steroidobacteraceae bacterium]|nr:hypothetical protein [Steroidobacteraceae bacterium]